MWLWLCLCFVSTVIAQNDIPATETLDISKKNRSYEEVLLKIWAILADLLDADGKTVKIPSRDHIQFALTLIKKTILENKDSPNVDIKEKLFLLEAQLAKYKGVYIHDATPLQALLDLELKPDQKSNLMFKYELKANDKPNCKQAFEDLIQRVHQDYNDLAKSIICSDGPINTQAVQYSLHPGYANQYPQLVTNNEPINNNIENIDTKWNANNNVGGLIQNQNPLRLQGQVNEVIEPNNLIHAVKLSKDTHHLIGNDYNADLEHAKNVADRINAMYQSSNTVPPPIDPGLYPKPPLRELNSNVGAVNIETQNNPWSMLHYSRPIIQSGYIIQSKVNPLSTVWNQSYAIMTNTMQSQPPVKSTVVNHEYTNPLSTFINSKYHPNPANDTVSVVIELPSNAPLVNVENIPQTNNSPSNKKLSYNSQPNQGQEQATETPKHENSAQYPYKTPTRTYAELSSNIRNNNYLNYNTYPHKQQNYQNFLQNSYAYKQGYNPYGPQLNYYNNPYQYYSQVSTIPGYTRGYKNYMFQQSVVNPQAKLFTMNYVQQNNPNPIFGQNIIKTIPAQFQTYKVMNSKPIQNYAYGMTQIQTNVPQFTRTNYYNGQPVIDKLADWVTGTNSVKLNSDNDDAEIELTYLVKKPPAMYNPTMFYIKFRMPYKAFAKHISELLKPQTLRSASPNTDLYTNLASQYNGTIIPSDVSEIPEDMKNLQAKLLVRARYIEPNEPGKTNPNSVDIINLVKEPELNPDIGSHVNTVANNAPIPVLRN